MELDNEKARINELETISGGLVDRLTSITSIPWTIAGYDVGSEEHVEFTYPELDVIYKLRTNCRISAENIPILNRMHRDGYRVLGVVPDDPRAAVRISPLTVRLSEGEIVDLMLGALDGVRATSLMAMDPGGS